MNLISVPLKAKLSVRFSRHILAILLLIALLFQAFWHASTASQTTDETFFNGTGYAYLRYADYRFQGEHPPLAQLWGSIPLLFMDVNFPINNPPMIKGSKNQIDLSQTGAVFLYESGNDPWRILMAERSMVIVLLLLGGVFLYRWALHLFGLGGALLSLSLYSFSPELISHGSLFTTDYALTFTCFAVFFFLCRYFRSGNVKALVMTGIFAGWAILSKLTGLIVLPSIAVLFFIFIWREWHHEEPLPRHSINQNFPSQNILFFWALGLLILCLGNKVVMPVLGSFCMSALWMNRPAKLKEHYLAHLLFKIALAGLVFLILVYLRKLFHKYDFGLAAGFCLLFAAQVAATVLMSRITTPEKRHRIDQFYFLGFTAATTIIFSYTDFPKMLLRFAPFNHYTQAFTIANNHVLGGHQYMVAGSFVQSNWTFFFALILVKTSLVALIFGLSGLVVFLKSRVSVMEKWATVVPPVILLLFASFVNKIFIGLRHVLPVYPFLFLFAGALVPFIKNFRSSFLRKAAYSSLILLMLFYASRTLMSGPHYLSFFSEWVGDARKGSTLVSDSSIDWGQDHYYLVRYCKKMGVTQVKGLWSACNLDLLRYYDIQWTNISDEDLKASTPGVYILSDEFANQLGEALDPLKSRAQAVRIGTTLIGYCLGQDCPS